MAANPLAWDEAYDARHAEGDDDECIEVEVDSSEDLDSEVCYNFIIVLY